MGPTRRWRGFRMGYIIHRDLWAPLYVYIDLRELINKDFVTTRLEAVFHRLRQFGLKLHPENCLIPWSHGLCKWSGQ